MRPPLRRSSALVLVLLLAGPPSAVPQESSSVSGLAGNWKGRALLTNDWPGHPCRYEGPPKAPAEGVAGVEGAEVEGDEVTGEEGAGGAAGIRLALEAIEGQLRGSVAIDLPPAEGTGCPPLRKRYLVTEVVSGDGVVNLSDSGGHDWHLAVRRDGRVLRGLMAWQRGGAEEPLAAGFSFPDGTEPGARLSGEVRLEKVAADEAEGGQAAAAQGAASAAPQTTSAGQHMKNLGLVLGATAVGLAGLYGVNQLGQGSSEQGIITCSPRRCIVGAPGEPCFCEGNVVSGAPCGETETGVEEGASCAWPDRPCEALLSCNSFICQDRFGRCPFN